MSTKKDGGLLFLGQFYERLIYPYKKVWWNITIPVMIREKLTKPRCREIAKKYLSDFDLDINVDRYPSNLSGGEQHIVLLARFALAPQRTLLLDEPVTAIDPHRRPKIWNLLISLAHERGKDVIITTHDELPPGELQNPVNFDGVASRQLQLKTFQPHGTTIGGPNDEL